jgi:hypothetical protein
LGRGKEFGGGKIRMENVELKIKNETGYNLGIEFIIKFFIEPKNWAKVPYIFL